MYWHGRVEVSYQNLHSTSVYLDSAWIETDKISASCSPDLRKSCLKGTSGAFGSCLIFSDFIYFSKQTARLWCFILRQRVVLTLAKSSLGRCTGHPWLRRNNSSCIRCWGGCLMRLLAQLSPLQNANAAQLANVEAFINLSLHRWCFWNITDHSRSLTKIWQKMSP